MTVQLGESRQVLHDSVAVAHRDLVASLKRTGCNFASYGRFYPNVTGPKLSSDEWRCTAGIYIVESVALLDDVVITDYSVCLAAAAHGKSYELRFGSRSVGGGLETAESSGDITELYEPRLLRWLTELDQSMPGE